jgi:hypothetical protein
VQLAAPFSIVTVAVALILWHFHDRFWWPPDDGAYAHVAQRILAGEVLNRDVQDVHAGYINFANALALRLFGDSLVSLRYPLAALGVVQAWMLFAVFSRRDAALAVVAPIALTALAFVQFLNPTAHWYCLFLAISTIACLHLGRPGSHSRLVALGFLVGTTVLFRQLTGVLMSIAVFAYLLLEVSRQHRTNERVLASGSLAMAALGLAGYLIAKVSPSAIAMIGVAPVAALVVLGVTLKAPDRTVARVAAFLGAGAVMAALPLIAYHLVNQSLTSWYADAFDAAMSLTNLAFFDRFRLDMIVLLGLARLVSAETLAHSANGAFWVVLVLLPAALGFRVVRSLLANDRREGMAPLPFVAMFYAVVSVHYETPIYIMFSTGLTLAGLLWLSRAARRTAMSGSVLVAVALYFHAGQSLERGIGGTISGARTEVVACKGLHRSGLKISPSECDLYQELVGLIQLETRPSDAILAFPTNAELYYLSNRRNPTRFFNAALGLAVAGEPDATLERLARDPPSLVIHRADDKYNTPDTERLVQFVRDRYVLTRTYEPFLIYRLRRVDD